MTQKFECPHCGQRISAEHEQSGHTCDCPSCNGALVIPYPIPPSLALALPPVSPPALPRSSAGKAGWICLGLGYATFWIFGFGFVFFSVTMILGVVAMCTNRVKQGVILLVSALVSIVICVLIGVLFVVGSVGAVAAKVVADENKRQEKFHQPPR